MYKNKSYFRLLIRLLLVYNLYFLFVNSLFFTRNVPYTIPLISRPYIINFLNT